MSTQLIAICERESFLTASLEREFSKKPDLTLRWFPYIKDFLLFLEGHPQTIAVIEHDQLEADSLQHLARLSIVHQFIATCPDGDVEYEFLMRELGVISVANDASKLTEITKTITKILY